MKNVQGAGFKKDRPESIIKQVADASRSAELPAMIINDNKVVYNHIFGV